MHMSSFGSTFRENRVLEQSLKKCRVLEEKVGLCVYNYNVK